MTTRWRRDTQRPPSGGPNYEWTPFTALLGLMAFWTFLSPSRPVSAAVTVTVGTTANSYVLNGRIVTPDQVIDGKVVVTGDTITCVGESCAEPPGATLIHVTSAYIVPGLID